MMKYNQLLATFVAVAFPIFIESLPAKAFNLVYNPPESIDDYVKSAQYTTTVGNKGKVYLDELQKIPPPNSALLAAFKNQFPSGWEFEASYTPIYGDFVVNKYRACPPNSCPDAGPSVGGLLDLDYVPRSFGFDPQLGREVIDFPDPNTGKVRWVQWVTDNHKLYGPHGEKESILDTKTNTPYYYGGSELANKKMPYFFYDNSSRPDTGWNHDWLANLYLAYEKTDPSSNLRKVQIFGGLSWSWHNRVEQKKKEPDPNIPFCSIYESNNNGSGKCGFNSFSDSLSSGIEVDKFKLSEQTPGKKFYAYIDNDIPGNRCNPNTYLDLNHENGYSLRGDNDSSLLGDGFASALTGTVSSNGTINLGVRAANGGRRGEDRGSYELNVIVFNEGDSSAADELAAVRSGGGGFGKELGGRTQNNPILPNAIESGWQVFHNVPGCRWYDPQTPYGFEFQALDDSLFTEILDFPVGLDNRFTVSVGDTILGEFSPGGSIDFVSLFGSGVSNFTITGIDSLVGSTQETAWTIQLAFNDRVGSFKMRPFSAPKRVPESISILGLLALGVRIVSSLNQRKQG